LGGGFWATGIMTGICFLVNYMTSSSNPTRQYFGSQYFWFLAILLQDKFTIPSSPSFD